MATEKAAVFSPPEDAVDISPKKDGGVLKQIINEGSAEQGSPGAGDSVSVHYSGTLTDGTPFDSSRGRDKFTFDLGKGNVIKAWDIGVATMKKGEMCKLICAPEYAYGAAGSGSIPANATLIFEVELFSWKGEDLTSDRDGGIIRSVVTPGVGHTMPNEGSQMNVSIVGTYEGTVFEEREVEFELGNGVDHGIVSGVEQGLRKFKVGEVASLKLAPKYAFGSEGKSEYNIPSDAEVTYKVTLVNFEKAKEEWEMNYDEKYAQAKIAKERGTTLFKAGNFESALAKYSKLISILNVESGLSEDEDKERLVLVLAGRLNSAMCCLKLEKAMAARDHCTKALLIDAESVKAHFRRGQSYMSTHDWPEAVADFQAALKVDPGNTSAKNQLAIANKKIKDEKNKAKSLYGGMFDKFAAKDASEPST